MPNTTIKSQAGAIEAPAALYVGDVMHARLKGIGHRFSYRVISLLIDLGRLDQADRQSPLFGVNRAALYSFHEADHGPRDGSSLLLHIQRRAAQSGTDLAGGRVLLLCYPRLLGFTFNPLSVYFCYRANGELAVIVYEVRNTFGDIHSYVLPVKPGDSANGGVRQRQDKLFYVSPFIGMAMRYQFRVSPPDERVKLRILETDREGPRSRRDLQRPPSRLDHGGAAARVRRPAVGYLQNRRGDPLGSATALAQGRAAGATSGYCGCEHLEQRLGHRRKQRLYCDGVVRRRAEARFAGERSGPVKVGSRSTASREARTQSHITGWICQCLR